MRQKEQNLLKKGSSLLAILIFGLIFFSCSKSKKLPIFGNRDFDEHGDTIFHTIPDFSFVNQNCEVVTEEKFKDKIYIADFFFTTCQGTCPIMTNSLTNVQKALSELEEEVLILSHTVDPETDSCSQLLKYGEEKGVDFKNWTFVTGSKKSLYNQAAKYLVVASDQVDEELHFIHSDQLVLIDKRGRIRGMYSGVDEVAVEQLIEDLELLIKESKNVSE